MKPVVVVDIGNTLIKWGRCADGAVVEKVSLAADDPDAWERQAARWDLAPPQPWAVSGVHRARCEGLIQWLQGRGDAVLHLERAAQLPLDVRLEKPDHVGIDRLMNAVAAQHGQLPGGRKRRRSAPAVIIDAGSAITVDWLDTSGVFRGGAILPGLRLMAKALHDYTDLLPLVEITELPAALGTSTPAALRSGVFHAAAGGIAMLIGMLSAQSSVQPDVFLTGGDAELLQPAAAGQDSLLWPNMTLEGVRLAAEKQA